MKQYASIDKDLKVNNILTLEDNIDKSIFSLNLVEIPNNISLKLNESIIEQLIKNYNSIIDSYEQRLKNIEEMLLEEILYGNFGRKRDDKKNVKFEG